MARFSATPTTMALLLLVSLVVALQMIALAEACPICDCEAKKITSFLPQCFTPPPFMSNLTMGSMKTLLTMVSDPCSLPSKFKNVDGFVAALNLADPTGMGPFTNALLAKLGIAASPNFTITQMIKIKITMIMKMVQCSSNDLKPLVSLFKMIIKLIIKMTYSYTFQATFSAMIS